jgi:hypothetical protein
MELRFALNVMTIVPLVLEVHLDVSHVLEITLMHQIVSHHHQKLFLLQLLTSQSDQLKLLNVIITVKLVNNFQAIVYLVKKTEEKHQHVFVMLVISKTVNKFVKNVTINVMNVPHKLTVKYAPMQLLEFQHLVIVFQHIMILVKLLVNHVTLNVVNVKTLMITVSHVALLELIAHLIVHAQVDLLT